LWGDEILLTIPQSLTLSEEYHSPHSLPRQNIALSFLSVLPPVGFAFI